MMTYRKIHPLEGLSFQEMTGIQKSLRTRICDTPLAKEPRFVSGVDVGYDTSRKRGVAVIITFDFKSREVVDTAYAVGDATLPYHPGFLAFRELPLFLKAWEKLETETDLLFFDGQGRIHPRRMGLATHAGFFVDRPTIGIAKNPFFGTYEEPENTLGSYRYVYDNEEKIGAVLRSKIGTKPVFVSAGNLITLEDALRITLHFVDGKYRLPMPTRLADSYTKQLRGEY
ncbi:endonuclease V [Sulfurimonas sp. HSL3-7]|uniref:endonuclease V n=1 Tax=Sulfonitrofixus jiaomeiensis TaxID=3131938 RepID=UPI0031F99311